MSEWIKRQWNDIKGNVKYALLVVVLGASVTGAAVLVRGLPWWKDAILTFLFVLLSLWAAVATWWRRKADSASAEDREPRLSAGQRNQIKLAGVLESKAGQADWLAGDLERIWHLYNNANYKLIYPLGEHSVPDPAKEFHDKELWAFRIRYRAHIGGTKWHVPDFHSDIMDAPYPWNVQYLDLSRKLKDHADRLRSLARSLESSAAVVEQSEQRGSSVLQIEALQLAKDLQRFQKKIPSIDVSRYDDTAEGLVKRIDEKSRLSEQIGHAYVAEGFSKRVTDLVHKLGAIKLDVADLEPYCQWVGSEDNIRNAIKALWRFAQEMEQL